MEREGLPLHEIREKRSKWEWKKARLIRKKLNGLVGDQEVSRSGTDEKGLEREGGGHQQKKYDKTKQ